MISTLLIISPDAYRDSYVIRPYTSYPYVSAVAVRRRLFGEHHVIVLFYVRGSF